MKKVFACFAVGFFAMFVCFPAFAWYTCVRSYDGNKSYCFPQEFFVRMVGECGGNYSDYYVGSDVNPAHWESIKNQTDPCNTTWIDEQ